MAREQVLVFDPTFLIYGTTTSFVVAFVVFKWIGPAISRRLFSEYLDLPPYTQRDWDDRTTSLLNAVISIVLSCYTLLYEDGMFEDKVWSDSFYARLTCALITGYMVADVIIMSLWCKLGRGEYFGYLFHHAATVYAYYLISGYGVLCYFGMLRLLAEMSTPFVNLRWYFDKLSIPRTKPYVIINAFMMLFSFLVCRMFTMPVYWYQIWQVTGTEPVMKLGHIMLIMYIPCFVLDILNIYWFYKMFKGFIKAFRGLYKQDEKFKTV